MIGSAAAFLAGALLFGGRLPPAESLCLAALLLSLAWKLRHPMPVVLSALLVGAVSVPAPKALHTEERTAILSGTVQGTVFEDRSVLCLSVQPKQVLLQDGYPLDRPQISRLRATWSPPPQIRPAPGESIWIEGRLSPSALAGSIADWPLATRNWPPELRVARWRTSPAQPVGPSAMLERLRDAVRSRFTEVLPPDEAAFGCALLLGERNRIPSGRLAPYRRLGLLHLLAVSGLHVWLWDALLRLLLPRRCRRLRLPLLLLVILLAGCRPPVIRAGVALLLRELQAARGQRVPGSALWAAALVLERLLFPDRTPGLSLTLSYAATAGILMSQAPPQSGLLRRSLQPSLGAWLGTAPILFRMQGTLEPWSIPLTPLAALLLPIRILLDLLALAGLGTIVTPILRLLSQLETAAFAGLDLLPATPLSAPHVAWLWILAFAGAGLVLLYKQRVNMAGGLLGVGLALLCWLPVNTRPLIAVLPVGHGQACLIAGEQESLWFDIGSLEIEPDRLIDRHLLPTLASLRTPPPRIVLQSHGDADHAGAASLWAERFGARRIGGPDGPWRLERGAMAVSLPPWQIAIYRTGLRVGASANDRGLALDIQSDGERCVLLGDQSMHELLQLVDRIPPGPIDRLLLPHHGRNTSGLGALLDHLQPQEAWASCRLADLPIQAAPLLEQRGIPLRTTAKGHLLMLEPTPPQEAGRSGSASPQPPRRTSRPCR